MKNDLDSQNFFMKLWDYLNLHVSMVDSGMMVEVYQNNQDPLE